MLLNKVFHPVFLRVDEFVILSFSPFCSEKKKKMNSAVITRPWTSNQTSLPLLSFKGVFEANLLKHWYLVFVHLFGFVDCCYTHTHVPAPPSTVAPPFLHSALAECDTENTSQMTNAEKKKKGGHDSAIYFNALKNAKKKLP